MTGLAPGAILESRYRIDQVVPSGTGSHYLGTVLETGIPVKVLELPPLVLRSLGRAQGLRHPNLCSVIEAIPRPGGHGLVVLEHVPGTTLEERLAVERIVGTDVAIVTGLDLADALVRLHQRGAAHGLLTPSSVIMAPEGRAGIVLGHAPLAAPPNPYHCPERGIGPPSPADDVWALAVLLHRMIVGEPPPAGGYRSRDEVVAAGVEPEELAGLLGNCLARRPENRVSMAHAVRDLLASWISAAQSVPPPDVSSSAPITVDPPPLSDASGAAVSTSTRSEIPAPDPPPSTPPAQVQHIVVPRQEPARRSLGAAPFMVAGVLVVLVVVLAAALVGSNRVSSSDAAPAAPAAKPSSSVQPAIQRSPPTPSASASQSGARPTRQPTGPELAECVMAQLPPDSFKAPPKVDWLCGVSDPRRGYSRLRSALVVGAKGDVTSAMSLWSRVRWYGMASFTVIRASCCTQPPPLELPRTASCGSTAEILNELHDVVVADKDHDPVIDRYTRNVRCHSQQGRDRFFGVDGELGGGQRTAFDELMALRRR